MSGLTLNARLWMHSVEKAKKDGYDANNDTKVVPAAAPNPQVINGRPVGTRTPDLYGVKNEVKALNPLPALLFRSLPPQQRPRNALVLVTSLRRVFARVTQ